MNCQVCEAMDKEQYIIYQDKFAVAFLESNPVVDGQVVVVPRQHYAIMEQVPNNILQHLFIVSNRISSAIFELLGAQGTNITINNGIPAGQVLPHFSINVIPRKENDGINFRWVPKQTSQQDIQQIAIKVKNQCDYIGHKVPEKKVVDMDQKEEISDSGKEVEDYRLKQLDRTP